MKTMKFKIGQFLGLLKTFSIFLVVTFTVLSVNTPAAFAHTPHDDIFQVDISPTYARDKTLFIIVRGNLLKSEDGGASWQRIVKGLDHKHRLYALDIYAKSKETLFLSSLGDGIYKSQDGGASWSKVNNGLNNLNIDRLKISNNNPNLVLATGQEKELYQTEDGGQTWHSVIENDAKVTAIAFIPEQENLLFVGDRDGHIYSSQDKGKTWQSIYTIDNEGGIGAIAVSPYFSEDQTIFIGTARGSIFKSTDGGKSFAQIDSSVTHPAITSLTIVPQNPNNLALFAVTEYDGVFYSDDSGKSWQEYSKGLKADAQAYQLERPYYSELQLSPAFASDRTVFLAGYNGLFKSSDGGQKWQELDTLSAKSIVGLGISPDYANDSTVAIGTYIWGAYLSDDGGKDWRDINQGLEEFQRIKRFTGISRVFEMVFSPNYASDKTMFSSSWYGLYKSTDGGNNWNEISWQEIQPKRKPWWTRASQAVTIAVSPNFAEDNTVYLGTMDGHILKSTNGGDNFALVGKLDNAAISLVVSPNFASDKILYAGIPNGLYQSQDGGASWQAASNGIVWLEGLDEEKEGTVKLAISPNYQADRTLFVGTAGGVFTTTNGGETWQQLINTGYGDDGYIEGIDLSPDYQSDRTLIVSVRGKGLFKSVDAGKTFTEVGQDLIDNNHLLANMYGFPLIAASMPIQFSPAYKVDRTIYGYAENRIFQSQDAGNTWSAITIPIPEANRWTFLYLIVHTSPLLTFGVAFVTALLSYLWLGYLRLDKILPWKKAPIRIGGTVAVFIIVLIAFAS